MSRPVYTEHVYSIRVNSVCYLKWRHLVNRLPLDNAVLKHQHQGVGRRHRAQARRALCLWNWGPRSTVSITGKKVFGQGLLPDIRVRCGHWFTSGCCSKTACRLTSPWKHCLRENVNFIELTIRPLNNPNMNQVNRAVWGNTSEDGFAMQKF